MTDRELLERVVAELSRVELMLFSRLSTSIDGARNADLAGHMPFSDDVIESGLLALADRGLVWKILGSDHDGPRWLVPRDIASCLAPKWRRSRAPAAVNRAGDGASAASGTIDRIAVDPASVRSAGVGRDTLTALVSGERHSAEARLGDIRVKLFAQRYGVGLGVLEPTGRGIGAGPRFGQWRGLDLAGQTRAMARLWLVDESGLNNLSTGTRFCLAGLIATLDSDVWYVVDSLARQVVLRVSQSAARDADAAVEKVWGPPGRSIRRDDLDRAIEDLGWIGVVDCAFGLRDRPQAIRLSTVGRSSLARD
jgi:hypothetical protein